MNKKYTENEVRSILAKAIDDAASDSEAISGGLSLEEVKQIGAEVGIDGRRIDRAALSVQSSEGARQTRLLGAPTTVSLERRIETDVQRAPPGEFLSVIRRRMGSPGEFSDANGLLEWRTGGELGRRVVTVSSTAGTTTVHGMADLGQAAVVMYLPTGLLGLIASAIGFMTAANAGNALGMVLSAALLPTAIVAVRKIFGRVFGSESRKLEGVVEDLAALVADSEERDADGSP